MELLLDHPLPLTPLVVLLLVLAIPDRLVPLVRLDRRALLVEAVLKVHLVLTLRELLPVALTLRDLRPVALILRDLRQVALILRGLPVVHMLRLQPLPVELMLQLQPLRVALMHPPLDLHPLSVVRKAANQLLPLEEVPLAQRQAVLLAAELLALTKLQLGTLQTALTLALVPRSLNAARH